MYRKYITAAVAAVLAATLLLACGSKNKVTDTNPSATATTVRLPGAPERPTASESGTTGTATHGTETEDPYKDDTFPPTTATTEDNSADSPAVEQVQYSELVGWWYRPLSYFAEERSYFDIFTVNEDGTYTKYNKYGAAVYTLPCRVSGTSIIFEREDGEEIVCFYDGVNLNNAEGRVEYSPGGPMEKFDADSLSGSWFRFGDRTGDRIIINKNGYTLTAKDTSAKGEWTVDEGSVTREDGTVEDLLNVVFTDALGKESVYALVEGGCVLYDSEYGDAYIHESALVGDYAATTVGIFRLVCYTWEGETRDITFSYFNSTFNMVRYDSEGGQTKPVTETTGRWTLDGAELVLSFDTGGHSDEATPFDGESFFLSTFRENFEKSKY